MAEFTAETGSRQSIRPRSATASCHETVDGRPQTENREPRAEGAPRLPARFCDTRDHSLGSKLAKRKAGKLETPNISPATPALLASIHDSGWTSIPRKFGQTFVIFLRLQFSAKSSVLSHRCLLPFIPFSPRLLCHREGRNLAEHPVFSTPF